MEKVGLEAVFADAGFQAGAEKYNKQVADVTKNTQNAAGAMTKSLSPASSAAGKSAGDLGKQTKSLNQDLDKLVTAAGASGTSIGMFNSALQMAGGVGAVYLAAQLGRTFMAMGRMGAQTLRTRDSFAELARQAGGSGDAIVAAVKRATDGTVSGGDIMASVNRGILLGLGANAEQWEKLSEVARFRARAMGIDMTQALSDITTGIGRESRMILDNLGIILDVDDSMQRYAATLGKTADQLTAAERKQAILTDVINIGEKQIAEAGGITEDATDKLAQMDVAMKELSTTANTALAPAVALLATNFTDLIKVMQGQETGKAQAIFDAMAQRGTAAAETGARPDELYTWVMNMGKAFGYSEEKLAKLSDAFMANYQAARAAGAETRRQAQDSERLGDMYRYEADQSQRAADAAAAHEKSLSLVEAAQDKAVASASQRMIDAEDEAGDKREEARKKLLDALAKEEANYAKDVAKITKDLTDVQVDLQDDIQDAAADAARERVKLAEDMADDIEDAEQDLQENIADLQEDANRDREKAQRDHLNDLLDLESDYQRDMTQLQAEFERNMADLARDRDRSEAEIREKYKEARIQELIRLGYDEAEIRAGWTDDMMAGPLKDQMDEELAALQDQYDQESGDLREQLERERAEREQAYQEQRQEAEQRFAQEQAERQQEYEQQLADLQEAYQKQLAEIAEKNKEALETVNERLAEEQAALRKAAAEEATRLREQLATEQANHEQREEELRQSYKTQLADIDTALADELLAIKRALGLELKEITDTTEGISQAWRDSYTQQLLDIDQYYTDRLARDAQYQQDLEDLFLMHSPSGWMEKFGRNLRAGLDIGLTTPSMGATSNSVVNNRTVHLSMPMTVNNGMDAAALQQFVVRTITNAIRV